MSKYFIDGIELSQSEYDEAISEGMEEYIDVVEDCEMCGGDRFYEKIGSVEGEFEEDVIGIERCQSCNSY